MAATVDPSQLLGTPKSITFPVSHPGIWGISASIWLLVDQGSAPVPQRCFYRDFWGFSLSKDTPKSLSSPVLVWEGRARGIGIKSPKSSTGGGIPGLGADVSQVSPGFFQKLEMSCFGMRFPDSGAFPEQHGSFWIRFHLGISPDRGKIRKKTSWIRENGG